jgi:UDP-GlcNAc:undecaprenyl-phosphate/decaprenyl-phosphate GlcNAc-1-phosphate transferase
VFWIIAVFSISISAFFTWGIREIARRRGFAAAPFAAHHGHKNPTPRIGGIAIFCTFLLVYGLYLFTGVFGVWHRPTNSDVLRVLAPGAMLCLVGLVDDLRGLRAWTKLAFQVLGGAALYVGGIRFCYESHALSAWQNNAACFAVTIFWVVLVCNAINLIDGLDGLAAGSVLFSLVTTFTVAIASGRNGVATATVVTAGALAGFLIFNFNPASIFLGDSGSLFVGFMLAGFALSESPLHRSISSAIAVPVISLALPITDTCVSILRRFLSGHSLFGADRDHIHHKLIAMGLTHRQAVWILYGCSATGAILSIALLHPERLKIPVVGILSVILFFGLRKLNYREFMEFTRLWNRVRVQKQVMARNIALRKAVVDLAEIHYFGNLMRALENCLKPDFCGVEISLSPDFEMYEQTAAVPEHTSRVWSYGLRRQSVLKLELRNTRQEQIGFLSLFACAEKGWLLDTALLSGELCRAVSKAIENCARAPETLVLTIPSQGYAEKLCIDSPNASNGVLS